MPSRFCELCGADLDGNDPHGPDCPRGDGPRPVMLNREQIVLLMDLLSHDGDVLGDLMGYGDEFGDPGGPWFDALCESTRAALREGRGPDA